MFSEFKNHINSNLPFLKKAKVLLAVSGGVDSIVLAYLCKFLGLDFAMAHCNFKLRGDESDNDEKYVFALAQKLNVEGFFQAFDTLNYAQENSLSTQMAARELRYNWFNDLSQQLEFDYILTAHHADDNLETFLINLSRGTGLEGLVGIPEINGNIVRPLLPFSRADIERYAVKECLGWREDASNASVKYLRNKIRHEVVPVLKGINPQLLQNFTKTITYLKESQSIVDDRLDEVLDIVVDSVDENCISFNIKELKKLSNTKAYLYQLLKAYNFTEWDDVYSLLDAQSGKQVFSTTHRLLKDRELLLLVDLSEESKDKILINNIEEQLEIENKMLSFSRVDEIDNNSQFSVFIDSDNIEFPLTLRKWQEGDYFFPFGMKGKKKLSKYFKDEKMSLVEKENVWLLCDASDAIVWLVGKRMDNRFRVKKTSKNILNITLR
ncbi:tRNA lysidine(34) synthetase TilS [Pontimicrobium sp. IMCC45349]|uniref:tRNA lysidine(34) synthetase TilS n=1 Tax=Pontimicrobium sp. IMCC45349 TaxID=3391574 RepID=UPI0039A181FE